MAHGLNDIFFNYHAPVHVAPDFAGKAIYSLHTGRLSLDVVDFLPLRNDGPSVGTGDGRIAAALPDRDCRPGSGEVGLDRAAAKSAFSAFMSAQQLNSDQTEFIDMIIDHLTDTGIVEPKAFYESPFSDIDDLGIAGVFNKDHAAQIIQIVQKVNDTAVAA